MNKNKINKDVTNLTDNLIKSDFSAIINKINKNEGVILKMESEKKKNYLSKKLLWIPAAALVSSFAFVTFTNLNVTTTVMFDVNPGIQAGLNSKGEVRTFEAINDDAKEIVDGLDVIGDDINEATEKLMKELVESKYISESSNTVLVSSEGDDADDIVNKVNSTIKESLKKENIDASVISQIYEDDDTLEDLAKKYNITEGKALLISRIVASNTAYKFEDLINLSATDLTLLAESTKNNVDVNVEGNTAAGEYITHDEALNIAIIDAKLNLTNLTDIEVEIDFEDNLMVYEVEFNYNNNSYDYDINAKTGEIVKVEVDVDNDDNDDNDNDDDDNDKDDNDDDDNDDDDNDDDDNDDDDNDDDDNDDDDNDDDDNDDDDNDDDDDNN